MMIELKSDESDWSLLIKKNDNNTLIAKHTVATKSSSTKFVLRIMSKSTIKLNFVTNARFGT